MAAKRIREVTLTVTNFDDLVGYNDRQIFSHFVMVCRLSKKRLVPKTVSFTSYKVERHKSQIRILFYNEDNHTFTFGFRAI